MVKGQVLKVCLSILNGDIIDIALNEILIVLVLRKPKEWKNLDQSVYALLL